MCNNNSVTSILAEKLLSKVWLLYFMKTIGLTTIELIILEEYCIYFSFTLSIFNFLTNFQMSCFLTTYKTNKFKMPLLNIIGTTWLGKNFYIAFVFLVKEGEEDYLWALEQLWGIFEKPDQLKAIITNCKQVLLNSLHTVFLMSAWLLCIWHIEKNVLVQPTKYFKEENSWTQFIQAWKGVIISFSVAIFEEYWEKLQEDYYYNTSKLVSYLLNTWINFWKQLFIQAYAD